VYAVRQKRKKKKEDQLQKMSLLKTNDVVLGYDKVLKVGLVEATVTHGLRTLGPRRVEVSRTPIRTAVTSKTVTAPTKETSLEKVVDEDEKTLSFEEVRVLKKLINNNKLPQLLTDLRWAGELTDVWYKEQKIDMEALKRLVEDLRWRVFSHKTEFEKHLGARAFEDDFQTLKRNVEIINKTLNNNNVNQFSRIIRMELEMEELQARVSELEAAYSDVDDNDAKK
jgi:hypothetical protein